MEYLATWVGSTFLKVWGATSGIGLCCLLWAIFSCKATLKNARDAAEPYPGEFSAEVAEAGFSGDWRSLQTNVSDGKLATLFRQFKVTEQYRIIALITVTVIAAFSGAKALTITRLFQDLGTMSFEGTISPIQVESATSLYQYSHPCLVKLAQITLLTLPGFLFTIVTRYISFSVDQKIGQLTWSKQEYITSLTWETVSVFSLMNCLVAIFLIFSEAETLKSSEIFLTVPALLLLGFGGFILGKGQAAIEVSEVAHPLPSGELRDRIMQLGRQANVKISQVMILPSMRSAVANAFARPDGSVMLTDYLVVNSHRSELDSIIAHEVAHLKHHHARWLTGLTLLQVVFYGWLMFNSQWLLLSVGLWSSPVFLKRLSRRFEYTADALATKLTRQPEMMIAALARLEQLNPLRQASDKEETHPTTLKRFEVIAKAHNLSDETVRQQLLQAKNPIEPTEAYPIPASTDDKIFPTPQKQKHQQRELLQFLIIYLVPLAAIAALFPHIPSQGLKVAIALAGLLIVAKACHWSDLRSSLNIPREARRKLHQQLTRASGPCAIVSLSPEAHPQSYEGFWFWDLGVLSLEAGQLCYHGGKIEFALCPNQISHLRMASDTPSLSKTPHLYLTWQNVKDGSTGKLRLCFLGEKSAKAMRQVTRDWCDRLETWQGNTNTHVLDNTQTLDHHSFATATATPRSYRKIISNLLVLWLLGAVGALVLVGLLQLSPFSWFYIALGPFVVAAYNLLCYVMNPQSS